MKSSPELKSRRAALLASLQSAHLDAILVSHPVNIRYLSGFTGSNSLLLITARQSWLLTDPRYTIQASKESDCRARIVNGPLIPKLGPLLNKVRNLGYEASHLSVGAFNSLLGLLPKRTKVKPADGLIERLRLVKSPREVAAIRAAVLLNSKAFDKAVRRLKPGWTERRLAAELDAQMIALGADRPAFDTIVASGPRSALPHARPTAAPIKPKQLCLIDMGAQLAAYCSDMTRMVSLGSPAPRWRHLHQAVLEAQLAALAAVDRKSVV